MKKIFTLLTLVLLAVGAQAQTLWNFSDWTAGTYKENVTKDGLTFYAGDGKDGEGKDNESIVIDGSKKTIGGISFTQRLKTGGKINANGTRALSFTVDGPKKITFYAASSSSSAERTLWIGNSMDAEPTAENALGTIENVGGTAAAFVYNYTGSAATLYVGSLSGGLNFYGIKVEEPSEETPSVLDLTNTEENETRVDLTKDNVIRYNYLSVTKENWSEREIGGSKAEYLNMSSTDRSLSIKVKGVAAFEVFAQNATEGRKYTITVGSGEALEITHDGSGVVSSGEIETGTMGEVTITLTGGGESVYPIYIILKKKSSDTPTTPHVATVWDFTKTTVELLDPSKWTEDAKTAGRYSYGTEIASGVFKDLGELGCSEGLGLFVGRTGGDLAANSIRVDIGKQIQINASNGVYKITDLAKDDVVRIRYKSASDEARKFTVTNGDVTELEAPANSAENAEKEATITVAANGDLLLTQSKAINVFAITVNAVLPEATGISTINAETVNDNVIYNLQGQRVDENYRGVVIKNGKKLVVK